MLFSVGEVGGAVVVGGGGVVVVVGVGGVVVGGGCWPLLWHAAAKMAAMVRVAAKVLMRRVVRSGMTTPRIVGPALLVGCGQGVLGGGVNLWGVAVGFQ